MSTQADRVLRIARDILGMATGSLGMLWQLYTGQVTLLGVIACLLLLGVPLLNLRALFSGTEAMPLSPAQSPSSSSSRSSSSQSQQRGTDDD